MSLLLQRQLRHLCRLRQLWKTRYEWYRKSPNDFTHRDALVTGAQLAGAIRVLLEDCTPEDLSDEIEESVVQLLTPIYALFREPHPYAAFAEVETIIVDEKISN